MRALSPLSEAISAHSLQLLECDNTAAFLLAVSTVEMIQYQCASVTSRYIPNQYRPSRRLRRYGARVPRLDLAIRRSKRLVVLQ